MLAKSVDVTVKTYTTQCSGIADNELAETRISLQNPLKELQKWDILKFFLQIILIFHRNQKNKEKLSF